MKNLFTFALLCVCLFATLPAFATHNRAGEITYVQKGPLTYEITITFYTKFSSTADRDTLDVVWGDGTTSKAGRTNGSGVPLPNDVKLSIYKAIHTYPSVGSFPLSVTDPNRVANIQNINNSVNVPFCLQTTVAILNAQFNGYNNSPVLLQAPIDRACTGRRFVHNPNAYDAEGDSIAFELTTPRQAPNVNVANYLLPNQIVPGINNNISLNAKTGEFVWDSPQLEGEYNVAFLVKEYRNGILLSTIIRDMQITVDKCDNHPPQIQVQTPYCVVAGQTLQFNVTATDPDAGDHLTLTGIGGMLPPTNSFATFNAPTGAVSPPVVGTFKWVTTCDDARQQDYQVVFKAVDDGNPTPLAALKTVSIHVVAPAPKTLSALVKSGRIELSWVKAYECDNPIRAPRFRGFTIWRKEGCSGVTTDICGTDLAAQGFTIIADDVKTVQNGAYFYTDLTPERGKEYTYVVTAKLAELNSSNYPLRFIQSLPSNAVCVQVSRDIPLMLKVDVATTSATAGTMNLVWTRPFAIDLDTLQNPGPYTYELQRATDFSGNTFVKVVSFTRQHYYQAIDTTYTDNGTAGNGGALNTAAHPYRYRVKFLVNGADSLGVSPAASSVYLKVVGTDSKNVLTWSETVPWTNARYVIYRRNAVTNTLDSIGNATSHIYADKGLTNGMQYCYMVRSVGGYHAGGLPTYTTNRSEEQCGTPIDTVPPCPLVLMVTNDCATLTAQAPASAFKNTLTWTVNPADSCANGIALFNVYYAPNKTAAFTKIATLPQPALRTYLHSPALSVAGCYYVTAVDSIKPNNGGGGNESKPSNIACVDNCPIYELPNVFTPNGDGVNDTYTPINPYRFVTRIELHIYNRWGAEVFTTTDPSINWDGRDRAGKDLAEGVYFYTCDVYENRIEGEVQRPDRLRGYIHLIRGE